MVILASCICIVGSGVGMGATFGISIGGVVTTDALGAGGGVCITFCIISGTVNISISVFGPTSFFVSSISRREFCILTKMRLLISSATAKTLSLGCLGMISVRRG